MSKVISIKGALQNISPDKFDEVREQLKSILGNDVTIELPKVKTGNFQMKEGSETAAVCRFCHSEFEINSIEDKYLNDARKRGLCEDCVKVLHKAEEIKLAAPIKPTRIGARNRTNPPTQKVRSILMDNVLPTKLLQGLLDKDFTTQHTGISFPMLKEAKDDDTTDARRVGKFLRYSSKVININDNKYYLTNEIVDRNLPRIAKMFDTFGIKVNFDDSTTVDIPLNDSSTENKIDDNVNEINAEA